ncbi:MAG: hydrogenase maturation protease [Paludibacterium sp.]|uniref:hydrogenase maturation protease n=1 Tax=Paludibacterium sp. TaxID=1917523 RepID=UPI0025D9B8D6|nr:hydrogenase maturation protease [Paludibacterium sp.]MBV8046494.1 hydrogenase maturation protease [Paludibacterium sp.]MBV8646552.1 hydrogenase maturation protease [Paludibacterium sp.]
MSAPILIFGYGNPARGDDALGPLLAERAQRWVEEQGRETQVDVLTDFQLSPEHAYDLAGRQWVIFVDAARGQDAPYRWINLRPEEPCAWTTHASSPEALLWYCQTVLTQPVPPTCMLSLAGEAFELSAPLSPRGTTALATGWMALRSRLYSHINNITQETEATLQ